MTDTVTPSRRMSKSFVLQTLIVVLFPVPGNSVCDLQDKFRNAIWQFDKILLTTQKVLRAAEVLQIPVYATTQSAAKLGGTVAELEPLLKSAVCIEDKTRFSMWTPEVQRHFSVQQQQDTGKSDVVLVGIESHICITQTTLDLLAEGHREVPLALDRLRAAGAVVTSSESWLYECMGDAAIPEFRDIAKVVKETGADTKAALGGLLSRM
ncbi:Isochorismatase hydrolase [Apiospora rasikravindrae]|uniref:Isochorismatase hydrolase n=1 Tax=Apiospora rasikravindrae TaxID=990691 RepID=A0ABR1T8E7_9PEZI